MTERDQVRLTAAIKQLNQVLDEIYLLHNTRVEIMVQDMAGVFGLSGGLLQIRHLGERPSRGRQPNNHGEWKDGME